ncbi:DUF6247 family protein [Saccharothrix luteola]|uniref:DUF6247 family protein n=1 Tax=Saccharothrix luteola TaxID=2893018 RepID=UPI001E6443C9|nr:DUF6247 family protein [Saccharothrix luteola]MCC8242703.1 DUF6247 family protein [Saccharothrix luteola]
MASPAASMPPGGDPVVPAADPVAIRAALTPMLVAEFDREWELVLERAVSLAEMKALLRGR